MAFILKQSPILWSFCTYVTIIICCLAAMKIEGSIEEIISEPFNLKVKICSQLFKI